MSRISKDSSSDVSNLSTLSVLPRRSIVNLTPVEGAIVYDLSNNSLAVSDGTTWSQVGSGNEIAGTPVGPFSSITTGDVLTWNGTTWINSPVGGGGVPSGPAGGDLAGLYPNPTLAVIGTATGPLGNGTTVPVVTIDSKGRVTSLTSTAIAFPPSTSQVSGTPIGPFPGLTTGDVLTWNGTTWVNAPAGGGGTPSGPAGGDLAGTYPNPTLAVIGTATGPIGNGTTVPVVTIDAKGRVTSLTSTPITGGGGGVKASLRRRSSGPGGNLPAEALLEFTTVGNNGFATVTPTAVTIPFTGLANYYCRVAFGIGGGNIQPKRIVLFRVGQNPNVDLDFVYATTLKRPDVNSQIVFDITATFPVTAGEQWNVMFQDTDSLDFQASVNTFEPQATWEFWTIL